MKKWLICNTYKIDEVQSSTLDACINHLKTKDTFSIDVETRAKSQYRNHNQGGLSPHLSKIVMIQVATDEESFAIDVREFSKKDLRELFSIFEDPYYKKIGQNIKFDYQMLKAHYNVDLSNIMDTMIIDQLLYLGKNVGFSLEKLAKRYLGISYSSSNQLDLFTPVINNKISKETRKQFKFIGNKPFTSDQILYGLMDAEYTLQIYFHQLAKVAEEGLFRAVTFECSFIPVLANMELAGFYMDNGMWMSLYESNLVKLKSARKKLVSMIKKSGAEKFNDFQASLFAEEEEVNINLNSSKQVIELCKALGIPTKVLDKRKSKESDEEIFKDSVEEKHLRKHSREFPIIAAYLDYKKLEKAVTTYGKKFKETHVNPHTGRVQSTYKQLVNTSRLASRSPKQIGPVCRETDLQIRWIAGSPLNYWDNQQLRLKNLINWIFLGKVQRLVNL